MAAIACDVLADEVAAVAADCPGLVEVRFLRQGLHDEPARLQEELRAVVAGVEERGEAEVIALVYGLCSRGVEGVAARRCRLVVPRAHDCITLLLGSRRRYDAEMAAQPGTYWYSPGWIRCGAPPSPERDARRRAAYAERFGAEMAEDLMAAEEEWRGHYTRAAYVAMDGQGTPADADFTAGCARAFGWGFERFRGDPGLLRDLLRGPWDEERFLVLEPGWTACLTADERVVRAAPAAGASAAGEKGAGA